MKHSLIHALAADSSARNPLPRSGGALAADPSALPRSGGALAAVFLTFASIASPVAPASGDRILIDDAEYILVRAFDWCVLTSDVAICTAAYNKMNATEEGRVAIHGRRGHTTITNGEMTVEYADGYRRTEAIKTRSSRHARIARSRSGGALAADPSRNSTRSGGALAAGPSTVPAPRNNNRPSRLEALLKKREAIKNAKPVEVTVEVGGAK